jgi:ferredoxin
MQWFLLFYLGVNMADKSSKTAKCVPGKYYVDTNCISCGQCVAIAPDYFSEDTEASTMYVANQPTTEAGRKVCREALESCPVQAIGDDAE